MKGRALTAGGILAALAPASMWAYQNGVITATGIQYALIIAGLALLSLVISWGLTEAYKRLLVPEQWGSPAGRRRIYAAALVTGTGAMLLCGVVFLVLVAFTWRVAAVVAIMWLLASVALGVSSPWLWSLVFERMMPAVYQCLPSRGPGE